MALYLDPVPRQIWNVPCRAHRTNGEPCRAWAMRGQHTCWSHGGASPQARAWAGFRLQRHGAWVRAWRDWSLAMRNYRERLERDPEAVYAEVLADAAAYAERVKAFRRQNGRRPRRGEMLWAEIGARE
jgi:hypothetical protein